MREIYVFKITREDSTNARSIRIAVRANSNPDAWIAVARERKRLSADDGTRKAIADVAYYGASMHVYEIVKYDARGWKQICASVDTYNAEAALSATERFHAMHDRRIAEEIEIETYGYSAFVAKRAEAQP